MVSTRLVGLAVVAHAGGLSRWRVTRSVLARRTRAVQRRREKFFEQNVRPLLVEKCYSCHAAKKQKGGLRLDSIEAILKGGESGPAVVPGKPDESLLVSRDQLRRPGNAPGRKARTGEGGRSHSLGRLRRRMARSAIVQAHAAGKSTNAGRVGLTAQPVGRSVVTAAGSRMQASGGLRLCGMIPGPLGHGIRSIALCSKALRDRGLDACR